MTSPMFATEFGRADEYPGAEVAVSVMLPIAAEWWFLPVSNAVLVGAHIAAVWNRLYFKPFPASRSNVGV
jgi:hypothetical protein